MAAAYANVYDGGLSLPRNKRVFQNNCLFSNILSSKNKY